MSLHLCQKKKSLNTSRQMLQKVTTIPIIEESGDVPSNTNTLCPHRNKEQSEYLDTHV